MIIIIIINIIIYYLLFIIIIIIIIIIYIYFWKGLHGPETAEELRRMGFSKTIVALTGNCANPVDVTNFLAAGADSIVAKPFNSNDLINVYLKYIFQLQ